MNELPNHHDKQSNSSSEERFVPRDNDAIRETVSGDKECGLAKWYWACQHFTSWNKNIFWFMMWCVLNLFKQYILRVRPGAFEEVIFANEPWRPWHDILPLYTFQAAIVLFLVTELLFWQFTPVQTVATTILDLWKQLCITPTTILILSFTRQLYRYSNYFAKEANIEKETQKKLCNYNHIHWIYCSCGKG